MKASIVAAGEMAIAEAAARLREGELVAFPTETVYGLGADATNPVAVRKIFAAKGRPPDHPLIVHLPDASHVGHWAREFPPHAQALASAFWPGPLTLVLPRSALASDLITGGQDSVGVRVPSHPVARELLAAFSGGIAAPSANRFGRISPTTAQHVADDLGAAVATILDAGPCALGIESTIVACVGAEPALLRPGAIGPDAIARVLGRTLRITGAPALRAPGTLAAHYAPKTRAQLVAAHALRAEIEQLAERDEIVAVLARTAAPLNDFTTLWRQAPLAAADYAHDLYANLRQLDALNADVILIEKVPDEQAWLAVRDRLARAARGEDDDRD